jgi:hypothetical protein
MPDALRRSEQRVRPIHLFCGYYERIFAADELIALAEEKRAALWKAGGLLNKGCGLVRKLRSSCRNTISRKLNPISSALSPLPVSSRQSPGNSAPPRRHLRSRHQDDRSRRLRSPRLRNRRRSVPPLPLIGSQLLFLCQKHKRSPS